MQFPLPDSIEELPSYFPPFLDLADEDRWWKRMDQLTAEGQRSPFMAKIMADHHWLELELSMQIGIHREHGHLLADEILPKSMAALQFAAMAVETHRRLSDTGKANLAGRLRDSLKTGFPGLYFELDMAHGLLNEGFDVSFSDFERTAAYDIHFQSGGHLVGELECKSMSADAGRKIHRKDFYRIVDSIGEPLMQRAKESPRMIVLITLEDRLTANAAAQRALRSAVSQVLSAKEMTTILGEGFSVEATAYDEHLADSSFADQKAFYTACCRAFGANCHVSGGVGDSAGCIIIMRSRREDDHSKPQLEALKKATSQLTGTCPGFVALQFEDIEPADLALSHLRRRSALLANAVFHSQGYEHLAAVYHTAFGGLHPADGIFAKPAFVCWNPTLNNSMEGFPFKSGITNSEFAVSLGVHPEKTDSDGYLYGREV